MKKFILLIIFFGVFSAEVLAEDVQDKQTNDVRRDLVKVQKAIAEEMRVTRDYMKAERQGRGDNISVSGLKGFQVGFSPSNVAAETDNITQFISKDTIANIVRRLEEKRKVAQKKTASLSGLNTIDKSTENGLIQMEETEQIASVPEGEFHSEKQNEKSVAQKMDQQRKGEEPEKNDYIDEDYDYKKGGEKYVLPSNGGQKKYAEAEKAYSDQKKLILVMALILLAKEETISLKKELDDFFQQNGMANFNSEEITIAQALAQHYATQVEMLRLLAMRRQITVLANEAKTYQGTIRLFPLQELIQGRKAGEEKFKVIDKEGVIDGERIV